MVGSEKKSLVFAYYVTGHGFGNATRVVEVVCNLIQAGHEVHVVTGAPNYVYTTETQSPGLFICKISDVVPVACRAAADAGIREDTAQVREELGILDSQKVLIYNFGEQPAGWKLKKEYLPEGWICLVCGTSEDQEMPSNFVKLPKDFYTPDAIAASDVLLGKIGYGTTSEALAYKVPLVFVRRDYFNEEPFLRNMIEHYQAGVEMIRRDLLTGHWAAYIERAITLKPCYDGGVNGGEVAARILQDTAMGKHHSSHGLSGARRLGDAIVLGYQLQRITGKDIAIPEWYSLAQNELSSHTQLPNKEVLDNSSLTRQYSPKLLCISDYFAILHGDHQGLPDTLGFLKSLAEIQTSGSPQNNNKLQIREHLAAAAMFNWEEETFVSRAPGRLYVMGGVADHPGSLVL